MGLLENLKKLSNAKPSEGGGPYVDVGMGRLSVKDITVEKIVRNKQGANVPAFLARFQVESCTAVPDDNKPPYPPGTELTFFQFWDGDAGPNNILAFLMALTGNPQSDFSAEPMKDEAGKPVLVTRKDGTQDVLTKVEAIYQQVGGVDQPLRGAVIDYACRKTFTRVTKIEIHPPKFTHVIQTAEQIAANRARLDASAKA